MSGKEFKNVLLHTGMTLTDIAGKLSMSTQALNSIFNGSDVRSGIIEKCVDRLGMSFSDFYPANNSVGTNFGAAFGSNVHTINTNAELDKQYIELLDRNSKQLTKSQEQIDRLLGLLEAKK